MQKLSEHFKDILEAISLKCSQQQDHVALQKQQ